MHPDRRAKSPWSKSSVSNRIDRRQFGIGALGAAAALITGSAAKAQTREWPEKSIRIIEYYPAGVARDNRTRVIAEKLSALLGQQVYVENRPGASGRIGLAAAVKAAPDGYNFTMIGPGDIINRHLFDLPYDIERDLDPVSMIETLPVVAIARASLPVVDMRELVRYAKEHPGELKYASSGMGSFHHMNGLLFGNVIGAPLQHIPYAQGNPAADLLGGHVDLMFDPIPAWLENVRAGRLRALAFTGETRANVLPDVPTFAESGLPAFDSYAFYGVMAPKGTPQHIIAKLQESLSAVVKEPNLNRLWTNEGGNPVGSEPTEFAARIRRESDRWSKVIRDNGVKIQ
jgi:tripartite-type tricarboxylate transporter receptor subunit TctC